MVLCSVGDSVMPQWHNCEGGAAAFLVMPPAWAGHVTATKGHFLATLPRRAGRLAVRAYQLTLSPLIGFHCRHLPTCSSYADEALARFGLWAGGWMTLARLLRCHPFGTSGLDFVPEALPAQSRWYLPWRYGRWRGTNAQPAAGASPARRA
jgi:uncharacterized protein